MLFQVNSVPIALNTIAIYVEIGGLHEDRTSFRIHSECCFRSIVCLLPLIQ